MAGAEEATEAGGQKLTAAQRKRLKAKARKADKKAERWAGTADQARPGPAPPLPPARCCRSLPLTTVTYWPACCTAGRHWRQH